jgi:hypothetical protein
MYIPSTYQVITYFLHKLVTKVKPNINSIEFHQQLSKNRHPVDGALRVLVHCGPLFIPFSYTKAYFKLGVRANVQPKSSIPIGGKVEIKFSIY